jgi:hypothetical protein
MTYSIFHPVTGLFTGQTIEMSDEHVMQNTPEGYLALPGKYDYLTQKVNVDTFVVESYTPPPEPTELVALRAAFKRSQLLTSTDWVVTKYNELQQPIPTAWLQYRQALRDITVQPGFPHNIDWPILPQV